MQSLPDLLIVGAGILGLWTARHAIRAGKKVVVVDRGKAGSGASGGFVGALMPHMPDAWNDKKQLQFEGLDSIAGVAAELEQETGIDCGFRRCGRVMPIHHENTLAIVQRRIDGAKANWPGYRMELLERPFDGTPGAWVCETGAPFGLQHDTLSARIDPRAYIRALSQHVRAQATLIEGCEVVAIDPARPGVTMDNGDRLGAGKVVVAGGWQSYGLLEPFMGHLAAGERLGTGVKGQALLLQFSHDDRSPIVYDNGSYVVPHSGNRVAVGATSRSDWQRTSPVPDAFDENDTDFLEKACVMVRELRGCRIVEKWAGVRPRNRLKGRGTEPFVGSVPGYPDLLAAIGAFKIGFGIAHIATGPNYLEI